jgi:hypothetical protein
MSLRTHLTHKQLSELLLAEPEETSPRLAELRGHLRSCPVCAAEIASLQQSLSRFRSATTAWAGHASASRSWLSPGLAPALGSMGSMEPATARSRFRPLLWAAAAVLLAAAIPFAIHNHRSPPPPPTADTHIRQFSPVTDEALLEEIDQTLSSSVPTPMQPLADPTAGHSSQIDSTPRKN